MYVSKFSSVIFFPYLESSSSRAVCSNCLVLTEVNFFIFQFQRTALQKADRNNHQYIVGLLLRNNATPSYKQPVR